MVNRFVEEDNCHTEVQVGGVGKGRGVALYWRRQDMGLKKEVKKKQTL